MKEFIIGFIALVIFLGTVGTISLIGFFIQKGREATRIDTAVQNYEEFQEIYNTTSKLNNDLCNIKKIPDDDASFNQISKSQRIFAIETNLNRWVEEYNAKSNMWGRNLWKSQTLPKELSLNQFSCNN